MPRARTPVTGGNVSFYNESEGSAIWPTPVVGVLGTLADYRLRLPSGFPAPGLAVYLLGESFAELGGSEFADTVLGVVSGTPPALDLEAERRLQDLLQEAAAGDLLASAHDCSDGGVAVALAECAILGGHGFAVTLAGDMPSHVLLFGESASAGRRRRGARTGGLARGWRPRAACRSSVWARPGVPAP